MSRTNRIASIAYLQIRTPLRGRIRKPLISGETLLDRWHQGQLHVGQYRRVLLATELCANHAELESLETAAQEARKGFSLNPAPIPISQIQIWTAPIVRALLPAERSSGPRKAPGYRCSFHACLYLPNGGG